MLCSSSSKLRSDRLTRKASPLGVFMVIRYSIIRHKLKGWKLLCSAFSLLCYLSLCLIIGLKYRWLKKATPKLFDKKRTVIFTVCKSFTERRQYDNLKEVWTEQLSTSRFEDGTDWLFVCSDTELLIEMGTTADRTSRGALNPDAGPCLFYVGRLRTKQASEAEINRCGRRPCW